MLKNSSCNNCKKIIQKDGKFMCIDDKTLYGYPRFTQINLDGKVTSFSYDSDDDSYDECSNCKLIKWFEIRFGSFFKEGNIPILNLILETAEDTFNIKFTNENTKSLRIKEYLSNIYNIYLQEYKE